MIMNILVTINKNYIYPLIIMLYSYLKNNSYPTTVYVMNTDLKKEDFNQIQNSLGTSINLIDIKIDDHGLKDAPVSKKFPITMYYRLFAWKYLPKTIDKVLYLDPDIIIKGNIMDLYQLNLKQKYFAGASHVGFFIKVFNDARLKIKYKDIYVNSGVLLINLKELRKSSIDEQEIYTYIYKNKRKLFLPDQDIISSLYKNKILKIDTKIYNFTEKMLKKHSIQWVDKNTKIIHYCGKNKPWKKQYHGKLGKYYLKYEQELKEKL